MTTPTIDRMHAMNSSNSPLRADDRSTVEWGRVNNTQSSGGALACGCTSRAETSPDAGSAGRLLADNSHY